jgi:hypothetical protein
MRILTDAYKDATFFIPYSEDKTEGVFVRPMTSTMQIRIQNDAVKEAGADISLADRFVIAKTLQSLLVGWQGFYDVRDNEIPFSEQAIKEICECDPDFAALLATRIRHVARLGEIEDEKN